MADGLGVHVPKGYIYAAMAFSALIEGLNMLARRAQRKSLGATATLTYPGRPPHSSSSRASRPQPAR